MEETQLHCDASCEPATALCVDGYEILVQKTPCLRCHFVLKTIILPSQARDKHIVLGQVEAKGVVLCRMLSRSMASPAILC